MDDGTRPVLQGGPSRTAGSQKQKLVKGEDGLTPVYQAAMCLMQEVPPPLAASSLLVTRYYVLFFGYLVTYYPVEIVKTNVNAVVFKNRNGAMLKPMASR